MSKKYDACRRLQIEGKEKAVWPKVGMTVTIKDDGKVSIYDARSGESFFCFERTPREDAPAAPPKQADSFDDGGDVPF